MKYFDWDDAKLRSERGIGFEDIIFHIERGDLLDILEHSNSDRHAGQRIFVVRREGYVHLLPFAKTVFLKMIIPSRKATKQYLGEAFCPPASSTPRYQSSGSDRRCKRARTARRATNSSPAWKREFSSTGPSRFMPSVTPLVNSRGTSGRGTDEPDSVSRFS